MADIYGCPLLRAPIVASSDCAPSPSTAAKALAAVGRDPADITLPTVGSQAAGSGGAGGTDTVVASPGTADGSSSGSGSGGSGSGSGSGSDSGSAGPGSGRPVADRIPSGRATAGLERTSHRAASAPRDPAQAVTPTGGDHGRVEGVRGDQPDRDGPWPEQRLMSPWRFDVFDKIRRPVVSPNV